MISSSRDNVELTLSKVVVVVLMVCCLMGVFIYYFFKHEDNIHDTSLRSVISLFSSQLLVIRSQWLMESKPPVLHLKTSPTRIAEQASLKSRELAEQKKRITLNHSGWVDVDESNNACAQIWAMVMDRPLAFFNMPIGSVLINQKQDTNGHLCRYTVKNGDYFEYNSANGAIKQVINHN